jgi:hypothetical protein
MLLPRNLLPEERLIRPRSVWESRFVTRWRHSRRSLVRQRSGSVACRRRFQRKLRARPLSRLLRCPRRRPWRFSVRQSPCPRTRGPLRAILPACSGCGAMPAPTRGNVRRSAAVNRAAARSTADAGGHYPSGDLVVVVALRRAAVYRSAARRRSSARISDWIRSRRASVLLSTCDMTAATCG